MDEDDYEGGGGGEGDEYVEQYEEEVVDVCTLFCEERTNLTRFSWLSLSNAQ